MRLVGVEQGLAGGMTRWLRRRCQNGASCSDLVTLPRLHFLPSMEARYDGEEEHKPCAFWSRPPFSISVGDGHSGLRWTELCHR